MNASKGVGTAMPNRTTSSAQIPSAQSPSGAGTEEAGSALSPGMAPHLGAITLQPTSMALSATSATSSGLAKLLPDVQTYLAGWLEMDDLLGLMWVSRDLAKAADRDPRLLAYHRLVEQSSEMVRILRSIHTNLQTLPIEPPQLTTLRRGRPPARRAESVADPKTLQHDKNVWLASLLLMDESFEHLVLSSARAQLGMTPPPPRAGDEGFNRLHDAISSGRADEVEAFLDEYLAIPTGWLATPRKVDWLRQAKEETSTLAYFAQYQNKLLNPVDRARCEAARAYVRAVAGSPYLGLSDKHELLAVVQVAILEVLPGKTRREVTGLHLVRVAMSKNRNPGFAAAVLLGISESRAEPEVKAALLASVVQPWSDGLAGCAEKVIEQFEILSANAPEWIRTWVDALHAVQTAHAPLRERR